MAQNLDSAAITFANFVYISSEQHDLPIAGIRVADALRCALLLKEHVLSIEVSEEVWVQHQELHKIEPGREGVLYCLDGAATLEGRPDGQIAIFALTIPQEGQIRWSWSAKNPARFLEQLDRAGQIIHTRVTEPQTALHKRLFMTLVMLFQRLLTIPHSPTWIQAGRLADCAPAIIDPGTALERVQTREYLWKNEPDHLRDMELDRYADQLHPAEQHIASVVNITVSQYLLVKKQYFIEFKAFILRKRAANRPARGLAEDRAASEGQQSQPSAQPVSDDGAEGSIADTTVEDPDDGTDVSRSASPAIRGGRGNARGRSRGVRRRLGRPPIAEPDDVEWDKGKLRKFKAHTTKVQRDNHWTWKQARLLVEGWIELGFLEEHNIESDDEDVAAHASSASDDQG